MSAIDQFRDIFRGYAGGTYRADGRELDIAQSDSGSFQDEAKISDSRIAEELDGVLEGTSLDDARPRIEQFVTEHFGPGNGGLVDALVGAAAH